MSWLGPKHPPGVQLSKEEFQRVLDSPLRVDDEASNPLTKCPDCGAEISRRATACPKCGAPMRQRVDVQGERCPVCGNRNSTKAGIGCALWIIAWFTLGLALLAYLLLPRKWTCRECGNSWRV